MNILLKMYLNYNLGDDIFLMMISKRYPNNRFISYSSKTRIKRLKVDNIVGNTLSRKIIKKVLPKLDSSRYAAQVVLGGSMFIDRNIPRQELINKIDVDYKTSMPVFILGANFGPFYNEYYLSEYKKLFSKAKDICFRERYSAELFKDLDNVRVAPDIVFSLDKKRLNITNDKKVVISVINLEQRKRLSQYREQYERAIIEMSQEYTRRDYEVILMSFCKAEGDELAIERIISAIPNNEKVTRYYYDGNINQALNIIASSEIVVGTRFHSIVLGLVFEKKVIPIIYSDKTKHMLDDIDYRGKMLDIANMASFDVNEVNEYAYNYGSVEKLSKESEKHFEKLDEFIKENS